MNMAVQSIEPRGDYRAIRERLWGKPRVVNVHVEEQRRIEEYRREQREKWEREQATKKPDAEDQKPQNILWVRQFNSHVIDYRRWQLAQEWGRDEDDPIVDRPKVNDIILAVLDQFPGVTIDDVKGPRRQINIVQARHRAIHEVYRRRKDLSLPQIGQMFGNRDHATIIRAVKKYEADTRQGPARPPSKFRPTREELEARAVAIRKLLDSGKNANEIALVIGSSNTTVRKVMKQRGWTR